MSDLTANGVNGLMEAYAAVYDTHLREQLEEEREEEIEVQEVGFQIIENAANVLFSQGYDVNDLCDYFAEASTGIISEDYLNFIEGQTYISESFIVSDEYVQEQFNLLEDLLGASEMLSEAGFMASQKAKLAAQRAANPNPVPKSTPIPSPAKPKVTSSSNPKVTSPTNSRVTSSNTKQAWQGPARPPSNAPKPGILQRAGNFAKGLMSKAKDVVKKIPGAGMAAKIAKSPVGKFAGKVGSRVLPGVGVVAYGADAAKRFKKGDWGGGLLSTAGAVTSAIPGAGLVAGLAPAAIQAGTDALGLTGDRSKKGPKTVGPKLVGPKIVGPKLVGPKIVGPKSSSSSGGGGGSNSSGGGGRSSTPLPASPKPSPAKPKVADKAPAGETKMQQWARANPKLAAKVKIGQSGYDEISATRTKPGPNEKQDQTPTQGSPDAKIDTKAVDDAIKAQKERDKNRVKPQAVNASYEYDAYDLVLEYLFSQGHVETLEEANYVMLVMDAETIGTIVEECENDLLAEEITEWVNELVEDGYDLSEYTWEDLAEYYVNEANKAEKMLGLTSRQRERARNLNQYTDKPIFYGTNPNRRKKADNSDPILNKAHKGMTTKRKASHRAGRGTRGDSGESTNVVKSRYQANKDHEDGYPSITKRGQGPT
jgi:hypothetical protein